MKVVFNIRVEKDLTEAEQGYLFHNNITTSNTLTEHILSSPAFVEDLLLSLDFNRLLDFNAEVIL